MRHLNLTLFVIAACLGCTGGLVEGTGGRASSPAEMDPGPAGSTGESVDAQQAPRTTTDPADGMGEGRPSGSDSGAEHVSGTDAAAAADVSPGPFSAVQAGQSDAVSTSAGKWSLGTGTCRAPYTGNNALLDGKQAGARSLCFTELVASKGTGLAFGHDGTGLWWRWNGVDQWTPEVTGDPRKPTPAPALGPNNLYGTPNFADGTIKNWYVSAGEKGGCVAPGCSYVVQKVSPTPGGSSIKVTASPSGSVGFGTWWHGTPGKTYLMSVWTSGERASVHAEHDLGTPSRYVDSFATTGWVQSFCKLVPVKPDPGSPMLKLYFGTTLSLTNAYIGEVSPTYPAPMCIFQH